MTRFLTPRPRSRFATLVVPCLLAGCTNHLTDPADARSRPAGILAVTVSATGEDIPSEGFLLTVGGREHRVATSGTTGIPLPVRGSVPLEFDVPAHCMLAAPLPTSLLRHDRDELVIGITCRWREVLLFTLRDTASAYPSLQMLELDSGELHPRSDVVAWHGSPRMSPDHRSITFASYRRGDSQSSIYVMQRDGSDPRKIADPGGSVGWYAVHLDPTWSPDGTRIAFRTIGVGTAPVRGIVIINADGSAPWAVGVDGEELDWSPTRSELVFAWDGHLHVLDTQTGAVQQLTTGLQVNRAARWDPSGDSLLVKRIAPMGLDASELWILSRDGQLIRRVDGGEGVIGTFSWSPDGSRFGYTTPPDGAGSGWQVHARDRSGMNPQVLFAARAGTLLDDLEWH